MRVYAALAETTFFDSLPSPELLSIPQNVQSNPRGLSQVHFEGMIMQTFEKHWLADRLHEKKSRHEATYSVFHLEHSFGIGISAWAGQLGLNIYQQCSNTRSTSLLPTHQRK
jgi:hypothetical protein